MLKCGSIRYQSLFLCTYFMTNRDTLGHDAFRIATSHMSDRFVNSKGWDIPSYEFLSAVSKPNARGKFLTGPGRKPVLKGSIVKKRLSVRETAQRRREEDVRMFRAYFTKGVFSHKITQTGLKQLKNILGRRLIKPDDVRSPRRSHTLLHVLIFIRNKYAAPMMKLLLQYGAMPTSEMLHDVLAMSRIGHLERDKLELLLTAGAKIDKEKFKECIWDGDGTMVNRYLTLVHANPNMIFADGMSPLLIAIRAAAVREGDYMPLIKMLVTHGADVNLTVGRGERRSPLIEAYSWGHKDIAKYLFNRGAHVKIDGKKVRYQKHVYKLLEKRQPWF